MMILFGIISFLSVMLNKHQCSLEQSTQALFQFYQTHNHTLNWYSTRFWTAKVGVDTLALQQEFKHKVSLREGCLETSRLFKK